MINIPLGVNVESTDKPVGESSAVIVDRDSLQATHFVVKGKERPHTERLVPIQYVQDTSAERIQLSCTAEEFSKFEEFKTTTYHQVDIPHYTADFYMVPFYSVETTTYEDVQENVPSGGVPISAGKEVQADDGRVGKVDELLEDPDSGKITHFVMREGHLWGKKDVVIPVSFVRYVDDKAIVLKVDKQTLSAMLAVPSRGLADLTSAALAFVTFPKTGNAAEFLGKLQKDKAFPFYNAAVLVKESDGKTSIREVQDMDKRHGAIFGAITGGLMGLLAGPAGMIVGAAAGAATGGVAAGRIDMGFPDEYLEKLQEGLKPGNSALVILLAKDQTSKLSEVAKSAGGQYIQQGLTQDILEKVSGSGDEGKK